MNIKKLFSIPWLLVGDKLVKAYNQEPTEAIAQEDSFLNAVAEISTNQDQRMVTEVGVSAGISADAAAAAFINEDREITQQDVVSPLPVVVEAAKVIADETMVDHQKPQVAADSAAA